MLRSLESNIFSTSDVKRGKPFPDIYLYAAQKMGVTEPEKCLVIEDSPLGIEGGIAAGMTVFGFSELSSEKKLLDAGAHHIFDNMHRLADEIVGFRHAYKR